MCEPATMLAAGALVTAAAGTGASVRQQHMASKAQKTAAHRQAKAQAKAAAAQANAAAATPGASHAADFGTSMEAAKRARGVQSTFLASTPSGQGKATLGV